MVAPRSRWDLLTIVLAGVILQYVWRVQEYVPLLAPMQFTLLVSGAAIVLFLAANRPSRNVQWALRNRLLQLVWLIFALAVASVPTSLYAGASVAFLKDNFVKTLVLSAIVVMSVRDRQDVERLVRVFALGGAGYVAAAILLGASAAGRLGGMGSYDPNDLGLFAACTIPFSVYMVRRGVGPATRILGAVGALLLLIGVVRSGSRGGFLALVALAAYGLLGVTAIKSNKRLAWAVVGGAVLLSVTGPTYWERMSTLLNPQEDYNWAGNSEAGRIEVWKRGIGYMLRDPLTGVGVDQFGVAEGTMAPQAGRQAFGIGFKWSAAHNSYVQIGAELGVFGLAAFAGLVFLALRTARRMGRAAHARDDRLLSQAFSAVLVTYAVGGAFLSQAYATYLYFAIALLIAFERVMHPPGRLAGTRHIPVPRRSATEVLDGATGEVRVRP